MTRFTVEDGQPLPGELVYKSDEYSFDTRPRTEDGQASVLVNDLQLEIDENDFVLFVWGLCPHTSWIVRELHLPAIARMARLRVDEQIPAGTSKRLNRERRWPAHVDSKSGVVCLGDPDVMGEAIRFAPGCVAVIAEGQLCSLWLEPRMDKSEPGRLSS